MHNQDPIQLIAECKFHITDAATQLAEGSREPSAQWYLKAISLADLVLRLPADPSGLPPECNEAIAYKWSKRGGHDFSSPLIQAAIFSSELQDATLACDRDFVSHVFPLTPLDLGSLVDEMNDTGIALQIFSATAVLTDSIPEIIASDSEFGNDRSERFALLSLIQAELAVAKLRRVLGLRSAATDAILANLSGEILFYRTLRSRWLGFRQTEWPEDPPFGYAA